MFKMFLMCATCRFGFVDQVDDEIVIVEYALLGKASLIRLPASTAPCTIKEGQLVMFDKKKILRCFKEVK